MIYHVLPGDAQVDGLKKTGLADELMVLRGPPLECGLPAVRASWSPGVLAHARLLGWLLLKNLRIAGNCRNAPRRARS